MKHTTEEVLQALQVIKDECDEQQNLCTDCPFYINYTCKIVTNEPHDWNLRIKKVVII